MNQPGLFDDDDDENTDPRHLFGAGDPENSEVAAYRIAPHTGTRKAKVLEYLKARPGVWVDGHLLAHPLVGGGEGKRRARELREGGHPVEVRPKPGSRTDWQYRWTEGT